MNRFGLHALAAILISAAAASAADRETKLVTRVEAVTLKPHGNGLAIHVDGKATTPGLSAGPAKLVRHGNATGPDKEGYLEYDMLYDGVRGYNGFKMRIVRANFSEPNVPPDLKGVRIFYEFGKYDFPMPPKKQKKSKAAASAAPISTPESSATPAPSASPASSTTPPSN